MTYLTVHLLGSLEVRIGEHSQPVHFPAQKTKSLLCYLLLNRKTLHSRDRLASLWWGNRDTYKARHCLNTTLWRLRQTLDTNRAGRVSFLMVEDDEIGFNTDSDYWVDVDEFEKLCPQARQLETRDDEALGNALRRTVALYRDDLLAHCYEEWCLVERQRLQQLYLFALSRLAAFHTRRHEYTESIACCQKLLACDPLREEVHRELIQLYLKSSRPQDAVRQFNACVATLNRELGINPMVETLALFPNLPVQDRDTPPLETQRSVTKSPVDEVAMGQDLEDILTYLSVAAEKVALAGMQIQGALHHVELLLARLDS